MAAALPGSELRMAAGGHAPWLTEPERIAGWAEAFLAEHSETATESVRADTDIEAGDS